MEDGYNLWPFCCVNLRAICLHCSLSAVQVKQPQTWCMTCRAALEPPKTTVDGISPAAETTADAHYDYTAEKKKKNLMWLLFDITWSSDVMVGLCFWEGHHGVKFLEAIEYISGKAHCTLPFMITWHPYDYLKKKKNMFLKSAWNQNVKYSFCKHSLLVLRWEIKPWKLITWKKKKITSIFRFSWKIRHYMQQLPVQTDFKYINVLKKIIISQKK